MLPHVDDLVGFLRQVDAVPAHLVGHSWGGFVSLLAAIRHPEVVRTLVLMEPPVLSLFVSTPPRPSELLRTLLRRPRTAIAIIRFGITAAEPAAKAYRRGDDEAGFETFARGVLGSDVFERLSAAERCAGAWCDRTDLAPARSTKPSVSASALRPARGAASERPPNRGAGCVAHDARGQPASRERGHRGVLAWVHRHRVSRWVWRRG